MTTGNQLREQLLDDLTAAIERTAGPLIGTALYYAGWVVGREPDLCHAADWLRTAAVPVGRLLAESPEATEFLARFRRGQRFGVADLFEGAAEYVHSGSAAALEQGAMIFAAAFIAERRPTAGEAT